MTVCETRNSPNARRATVRWGALAALLIVPLAGCSDDSPTTPSDEPGTMQAVIQDNGAASSTAPRGAFGLAGDVNGQFRGEVRVEVEVDGAWQTVTGLADLEAQAELQGGESLMGSATVEARTYDRVRIVMSNAEADVEAGSEIGIGPIEASVTLSVAGGSDVVLEYQQPVAVQAGATTRIVVDLNSGAWLTSDAVELGAVTSADFEGAATVLVQ